MYTIGEFSKLNRITAKALRHYDLIGLLKAFYVDKWTGYRYYDTSQIPTLRQIRKLKELGFGLDNIRNILDDPKNLAAMLEDRRTEIQSTIHEEQKRLLLLDDFHTAIQGDNMQESEMILKELPAVIVASMRTTVKNYDVFFDIVPKMGEHMKEAGAVCREPAYCFTIYHDGEYKEEDIDVEICEAVTSSCPDTGPVRFKELDAVEQAATMLHRGPYKTISSSYSRLTEIIWDKGLKISGPPRESYIDGIWNKEDPEEWLTEIQIPVE